MITESSGQAKQKHTHLLDTNGGRYHSSLISTDKCDRKIIVSQEIIDIFV
jgi:hypothetical protein